MHKKRKKRILLISAIGVALISAVALVLFALRQNINLYLTPMQVLKEHVPAGQEFRLGGLVEKGTLKHSGKNLNVEFVLTDFHKSLTVDYHGILPSLFRPGQGIVAQGALNADGVFVASQVLAKHDADYHPPGITKNVT